MAAFALRTVTQQLTTAPQEWGDPSYRLRELRMQVYGRAVPLFYVVYAVNEADRYVVVRSIVPLVG